jgi:hypothetical protein
MWVYKSLRLLTDVPFITLDLASQSVICTYIEIEVFKVILPRIKPPSLKEPLVSLSIKSVSSRD